MTPRGAFSIGGQVLAPGTRATVELPVSVLSDHTPVTISAHVVHGRRPGPVIFVSAAIHGDEVIGVEIVRRLLKAPQLKGMAGTLLAVPIVNTFGFLNHSRYLPDRRDLNRVFPGTAQGSLAARLAHIFLTQVVLRCSFGIDLHSAAVQRTNLPQVRLTPGNPRLLDLAHAFGAPVILQSKLREGSLRLVAEASGVDVLLYEAGEGLRFDEAAARTGVNGILNVMVALGMIPARGVPRPAASPVTCARSYWVRASAGGLMRTHRAIGDLVDTGAILGTVSDPFGLVDVPMVAQEPGIVIGRSHLPIVNEGDALFHIAVPDSLPDGAALPGLVAPPLDAPALLDEDEII